MSLPRAGVVGVGRFGQNHARLYAELPSVDLVGLYDIDADRGAEIAARNGTRSFASYEELLGQVDLLSVVTPTASHNEVALEAIRRGIPTLVEKPVCASCREAEELIAAAFRHGARLAVGHLERFNAAVAPIAHLPAPMTYFRADRQGIWVGRQVTVDVVADLMIHDIDLLLMADRSGIAKVEAWGRAVASPFLDVVSARLLMNSGAVAELSASRVSPRRSRFVEIHTSVNALYLDLLEQIGAETAPGPDHFGWRPLTLNPCESLREELSAFISGGPHPGSLLATGEDGLRALEVAERIVAAARKIHG
jgi:predicted dehydrogenase